MYTFYRVMFHVNYFFRPGIRISLFLSPNSRSF